MTSRDQLPQGHQQILDQIDAHGDSQRTDAPPMAGCELWVLYVFWAVVFGVFFWTLGTLLTWGAQ